MKRYDKSKSIAVVLGTALAGLLAAACEKSGTSFLSQTAQAAVAVKASATAPPTPTIKPTPAPSVPPSMTPHPTATPTPFGGTGLRFVFTRLDSSLVEYGRVPILKREQVLERLGREYEWVWFYPSPDLSAVVIRGYGSNVSAPYWYLALIDLSVFRPISSGNLITSWAPDSSQVLVIEGDTIYLYKKDGSSRLTLGTRYPKDGYPSWSEDSSRLYWTRNGELRVVDATTGKSEPLEREWLDDFLQVFWMRYSRAGDRIVFRNHGRLEGRKLYIVDSDFTDPLVLPLDREDGLYTNVGGAYWSPTGDSIVVELTTEDLSCSADCVVEDAYYLVDSTSLEMTRLLNLEQAIEGVEPYLFRCGLTPDGRNFVGFYYGTYFFFDIVTGEITEQLEGAFGCPLWLQGE